MGHVIKETRADMLTVEDVRALVRWCDNQAESWWRPEGGDLILDQILALYHDAQAADYHGLDEWASEDAAAARNAWHRVVGGSLRERAEPAATRLTTVPDDDPAELAKFLPVDEVTRNKIADAVTVYELRFEMLSRRDVQGHAIYSLKFAADRALCAALRALHDTGKKEDAPMDAMTADLTKLAEGYRDGLKAAERGGRELGRMEAVSEMLAEALVFSREMEAKYDGIGSHAEAWKMLRDFVDRAKVRIEAVR